MNGIGWRGMVVALLASFALLAGFTGAVCAEEYVLGAEDVVAVSVWMHPELERTLTINAEGNITLPPIGEVKAAGLTPKQLGDRLAEQITRYLRSTTNVTITVTQFMSRSVFVTGAVAKPGRYGFERIPTLVEVLGQAGGALAGSDLSAAQVIRKEGEMRRTIPADLAASLRTEDTSALPKLKPGDTIVIPGPGGPGGTGANVEGVGVLGEVTKPGLYAVTPTMDVWGALASAGGLTVRGNMSDVRLLTRADGGQTVTTLNLREVLERGSRAPIAIKPGDVVVVMPRGPSVWAGLTAILGLSRDLLNIVVVADYFQNKK